MKKKDNFGWIVLVTVILGTFLGSIDRTVVNLALPDIIKAFSINVSTASWIATGYILANAVLVPVWGKLGDIIGRKKVYLTGLVMFVISSVFAGFAWNFSSLLFFRIIQALAASADYPTAMGIITDTFSDAQKRTKALGIWSASMASGAILGPLIGGPIIDVFGWRSVFFLNLPVGMIGILMTTIFIKKSTYKKTKLKFDLLGAILLGFALSAIVLVLEKGQSWGWISNKSIISIIIGITFLIIFYFYEKNHKEPIIDFKFFKNKNFNMILLNTFIVFMGMMGSVFLIPLFAQTFLGYTATQTGYLFVPMAVSLMIAATLGAKLGKKMNPGKIIAGGTFLAACGLYTFSFLDPRSTALDIIIPLSTMAFGLGLGMSHRPNIIASTAPKNEVGIASSIFVLVRNIAGAFGVAVFATILSIKTENNVLDLARNTIINSHIGAVTQKVAALIILKAQVSAYGYIFVIASFFLLTGGFVALFIRDIKKSKY